MRIISIGNCNFIFLVKEKVNKKKNEYALSHFERLNAYLSKKGKKQRYKFNFTTPADFNSLFQKIREGKAASFRSSLDVELAK